MSLFFWEKKWHKSVFIAKTINAKGERILMLISAKQVCNTFSRSGRSKEEHYKWTHTRFNKPLNKFAKDRLNIKRTGRLYFPQ